MSDSGDNVSATSDLPATRHGGPLAAITLTYAALVAWSFGKWTDPHIDFGNELYVAWRLSEGEALYADIAQRHGPFSHYVNALWFGLFGTSLRVLVVCNLAILAGIVAMLYRVFRASCGALGAAVVCCYFLAVFAFSQYTPIANYNYVTPYHHTQTHGIALSLGMILCLDAAIRRGSRRLAAAAGLCLGCVFLGKVELFVPAAATAAVALVSSYRTPGAARRAVAFLAAALLPALIAFALLRLRMPTALAASGVLGNWSHLGSALLADRFYIEGAGLDDPVGNGLRAAFYAGAVALFALAAWAADRWLPLRRLPASTAAGALLFALLFATSPVPWPRVARALPITTCVLALWLWLPRLRDGLAPAARDEWRRPALFACYALALLVKMPLNARIGQYGFVLAMPATLLLIAGIVSILPEALRERRQQQSGGRLARTLGLAAALASALFFLRLSDHLYARKTFVLGHGSDSILVESSQRNRRGAILSRTLEVLADRMEPGDTLLVLPEGVGLNYWLRRENPIRYNLFLPTELEAFGGDAAVLRELEAHPPDFVVLAHRAHDEFGVGPFGSDPRNGQEILRWVRERYRSRVELGAPPFQGRGFGTIVLEREELPSPEAPHRSPTHGGDL